MKTIFRAVGPAFKKGLEVEPFESVNIYALLCKLLEITPEPNDGSLNVTQEMLATNAGPVLFLKLAVLISSELVTELVLST